MSSTIHDQEHAVRFARRSLWVATIVLAFLGAAAILFFLRPGSEARIIPILPLVIILGIGALMAIRPRGPHAAQELAALQDDELRRLSLGKAFRNGFLMVLLLQPGLALLATSALMAVVTISAGILTVLASLLWYDR